MEKPCSKCKRALPLDSFDRDPKMKLGRKSQCKECRNTRARAYAKANRERRREYMREWRTRNADTLREKKREWERGPGRDRRYGLAPGQYDEMYAAQHGACAICRASADVLCVDHCHETGAIRGLLCQNCNSGIGLLGDDLDTVRAAVAYLEKQAEMIWRTDTAGIGNPPIPHQSPVPAA